MGRATEALQAYERTVQLAPDFPDAWNNRGVLLRKLDRREEALECFARALQIDPFTARR